MQKKIVRLKKLPDKDTLKDLLELFVYYNLSYPTGQKDVCTIRLLDNISTILTPDTIYKLDDELYAYLYMMANKVTANIPFRLICMHR